MKAETSTEIGGFFSMWDIYRKILENNHMHHQEIYQQVAQVLTQRFSQRPFKMLDLGCGDACFIAEALKETAISYYIGFDLSQPALALAEQNIGTLGCESEFIQTDFAVGLTQIKQPVDVIFASYAVHHLTYQEKEKFFHDAKSVLNENGFILMVDVMREQDEILPVYLDRYTQWMTDTWTSLTAEELAHIHHHVRHYDITETVAVLQALAQTAGFVKTSIVHELPWHKAVQFEL